jgi:hypothetical protein
VLTCAAGDDPSMGITTGCVAGDAGPNAVVQDVSLSNAFLLQSAPSRDGTTYVWTAIPAGSYILDGFTDPTSNMLVYAVISASAPPPVSGDFTIAAGTETDITVYLYPDPSGTMPTAMASPMP